MKKQSISTIGMTCQSLGTSPSPGGGGGGEREASSSSGYLQDNYKGWSSERVPHPSSSSRMRRGHVSALATPVLYGGRQQQLLPSKWEDAERWICSPVLGYGTVSSSQGGPQANNSSNGGYYSQSQQRRPKSKSGPILPPGAASASPFEVGGGSVSGFLGNGGGSASPFTTGVFMGYGGDGGVSVTGENVGRSSSSLPSWSDLVCYPSLPGSRDEKLDVIKLEDGIAFDENVVGRVISRRDMATQMSPKSSPDSSLGRRSPSPSSILPLVESKSDYNTKLEIREVQVDQRATAISWSTREGSCLTTKALPDIDDCSRDARYSCSWDVSEAASDFSKLQREEAKISAWENLQKAKAEAAIRKLEMKLEKKRSSSMEKILNKLRNAQHKAREMRSSITTSADHQTPKRLPRISCNHKQSRLCSLPSCFTWHAF